MKQRPNVTDPQVQETDKRRFQRMRARKKFGKEYLSEIKQCVQKTDYLVNRPTPVKAQRKTVSSPTKRKTKKVEKKVDEDDLYPHVKFVIHPRIQNHKIPKFLNNQNIHQYSKTMAPVNEDQDYTKRSLSSSDQAKDRYNLSTLSATNVSDSNSSNADVHDDVQHNSNLNHNQHSEKHQAGSNSSDSFDDSARLASLNNDKVTKEVKNRAPEYSDYSDSDTNITKKPKWKFSDNERRGKSSAFSSHDFRWNKDSQINKISSSSDSDGVTLQKIKEEMKKDIEQEEQESTGNNKMFFGSESNELQNEKNHSLESMNKNKKESNSSIKINSSKNKNQETNSIENSGNYKSNSSSKKDNLNQGIKHNLSSDSKDKFENIVRKINKSEIKDPEIDSDFDDFPIGNKNSHRIDSNDSNPIPNVQSQEDNQQYSSDYVNLRNKNKEMRDFSKEQQFSSDSNNDEAFNSIPTPPQNKKNNLYNSQYSSSGDLSRSIGNEPKHNFEPDYKSDEFKYNNSKNNTNDDELFFEEEEGDDENIGQDSNNNISDGVVISQKSDKDRVSPELEKSLLKSSNSKKHFVETLSDGYDEDDDNNHFIQNKGSSPDKNNASASSSPAVKEADIPVSTEGEVDNTFNFASSTSESSSLAKKKNIEIENNIDDDDEDNSDVGFGNEDNFFYNGKNSSSSEDYEVVEATTDTRENEIRENRKLDRRIYSGDQK